MLSISCQLNPKPYTCLQELFQNFVLGVTDIEAKGQEVVSKTSRLRIEQEKQLGLLVNISN